MGKVIHRKGDLFYALGEMPIGHGVNCHGVMGSGIARDFKDSFPEMYHQYRKKCQSKELVPGGLFVYTTNYLTDSDKEVTIFNLASQEKPGRDARLEWIESSITDAVLYCIMHEHKSFALPRIGAGIGGLHWADVETVISTVISPFDVDVVIYTL